MRVTESLDNNRGFAHNFQRNRILRNASVLSACYVKHPVANSPNPAWVAVASPVA
jgi:hypothetical protein